MKVSRETIERSVDRIVKSNAKSETYIPREVVRREVVRQAQRAEKRGK